MKIAEAIDRYEKIKPGNWKRWNKWKKVRDQLQKECSQILTHYRRSPDICFFRGVKTMQMSRIAPAFKTTIRTERVAGFMPQHNADACDKIFKGRGYHAVRGNSIFCSTNLGIASHWGSTYIIFPLNGFKMTAYMGEKEYMYDEIDRNGVDAAHRMDLTSNVDLALKHRSTDVLITGTGYIGVLYDYEHHQEELKYLIS